MLRIMTIVILVCACAMIAQANLLTNGDFETGDTTGWVVDAPAMTVAAVDTVRPEPSGGSYSLHADMPGNDANRYFNLGQNGIAVALPVLSYDWYLESVTGTPANTSVQLQFFNASMVQKAFIYYWCGDGSWNWGTSGPGGGGDYHKISAYQGQVTGQWNHLEANIPADFDAEFGAGTWASFGIVEANMMIQTWGTNAHPNPEIKSSIIVYTDNVSLTEIPEPMTMSLLAMGIVGTILRRRRS